MLSEEGVILDFFRSVAFKTLRWVRLRGPVRIERVKPGTEFVPGWMGGSRRIFLCILSVSPVGRNGN